MHSRTGRFRRSDRILATADYGRVARSALRFTDRDFVLLVGRRRQARGGASSRLGITASRKVGKAVIRNRVKRRVREWFRRDRARLGGGLDLVVIARPSASALGGPETQARLEALLGRALEDTRLDRAC